MDNEKSIARYSSIEAGIADLKKRHLGVVIDVSTPQGMKLAKEGRAELKDVRIRIEKARKEEKEESLAYGRLVDSEAKRITSIIEPMEEAYDSAIKKEEYRKEQERVAKLRAEQEAIAEKIREEERVRAEEAARIQAEKDRIAAEEKKRLEEEQEKLRLEREAFELEKKAAQEKIDQENARITAEKKAIQEKIEAEERAERLKKETIEREARLKVENEKRQEQLKNDLRLGAIKLLQVFIERHGTDPEFKAINNEIRKYLQTQNSEVV